MTYTSLTETVGTVFIWQSQAQPDLIIGEVVAMLKYQGCRVVVFSDVARVVNAVIQQHPDLLLICLSQHEAEAYTLCQIVRSRGIRAHLPILFMGHRAPAYEQVNALRSGGNGYLQLPLKQEEGWLSIERHIQTSHLFNGLRTSLTQQIGKFEKILQQQEQLQRLLARENEALQRMAFVDGLTQVANRRSFNENIAKLWHAAASNQRPISLLLCDIDYFKRYNDTYGHLAGDDCLQRVAAALRQGARRYQDQVARYGGEEFAVVLPDTDTTGAQQVAAEVHQEIAKANILHKGSLLKPRVSMSIGLCTRIPTGDESVCEFINRTDKALYAAKMKGRDRTVIDTDTQPLSVLPAHRSYEQSPKSSEHKFSVEHFEEHATRINGESKGIPALPQPFWAPAERQMT